jgi:hypothetical protein
VSITFRLDRPYVRVEPTDFAHDLCEGEGCEDCYWDGVDFGAFDAAERAANPFDINLANANAYAVLRTMFNVAIDDDAYCGHIEPWEAETRLRAFLALDGAASLVKAPKSEQAVKLSMEGVSLGCVVHDCGRSTRQVDSYVERFQKLVNEAVRLGCRIVWS